MKSVMRIVICISLVAVQSVFAALIITDPSDRMIEKGKVVYVSVYDDSSGTSIDIPYRGTHVELKNGPDVYVAFNLKVYDSNSVETNINNPIGTSITFGLEVPASANVGKYYLNIHIPQGDSSVLTVIDSLEIVDLANIGNNAPIIEPVGLPQGGMPTLILPANTISKEIVFRYRDGGDSLNTSFFTPLSNLIINTNTMVDDTNSAPLLSENDITVSKVVDQTNGLIKLIISNNGTVGDGLVTLKVNDDDSIALGQGNLTFKVKVVSDSCDQIDGRCIDAAFVYDELDSVSYIKLRFSTKVLIDKDTDFLSLLVGDKYDDNQSSDSAVVFMSSDANLSSSSMNQPLSSDMMSSDSNSFYAKEMFEIAMTGAMYADDSMSIKIPLTYSAADSIKNIMMRDYGDLMVIIPDSSIRKYEYGPLAFGDNLYQHPMASMHTERGSKFEVFRASYTPIFNMLSLTFDAPVDIASIESKVFTLGSKGETVNVTFDSLFYDVHIEGYVDNNGDSAYDSTTMWISTLLDQEEARGVEELRSRSQELTMYVGGKGVTSQSMRYYPEVLELANINYPVVYGSFDGDENWVDSTVYYADLGKIKVYLNKAVSNVINRIDSSNSGVVSTAAVLTIAHDAHEFMGDKNNGPDFGNDTRFLVTHSEDFAVELNVLTITLSDFHKARITAWRDTANFDYNNNLSMFFENKTMVLSDGTMNKDMHMNVTIRESITQSEVIDPPQVKVEGDVISYIVAGKDWVVSSAVDTTLRFFPAEGEKIILRGNNKYYIRQKALVNGSMQVSDPVMVDASLYPTLSFKVYTRGSSLKMGFVAGKDERVVDVTEAVFGYALVKGTEVIDSSSSYTKTAFLKYPLEAGSYLVKAKLVSLRDTSLHVVTENYTLDTTVVIENVSEIIVPAQKWVMRSFADRQESINELMPDSMISIFTWDDEAITNSLFDKYLSRDKLAKTEPGRAYWVYSETELTIPLKAQPLTSDAFTITLKYGEEGWNQVANPYGYPIPVTAFGENLEFFKWNGANYLQVNYLKPYTGYWVNVREYMSVEVDPTPSFLREEFVDPTVLYKTGVVSREQWSLGVSLLSKDGKMEDSQNVIGVKPFAEDLLDDADKVDFPVSPNDNLVISFKQSGKMLREEYRAPITGFAEWKLDIGTAERNDIDAVLKLDGLEALRSLGYAVYLTDGTSSKELSSELVPVTLKTQNSYSLVVTENDRDIRNIISAKGKVTHYPNPVRGVVSFSVDNVDFAQGETITLYVYDVTGSVVAQEQLVVGGSMNWDARMAHGRALESGIYMYELRKGSKSYTNVMMVVE